MCFNSLIGLVSCLWSLAANVVVAAAPRVPGKQVESHGELLALDRGKHAAAVLTATPTAEPPVTLTFWASCSASPSREFPFRWAARNDALFIVYHEGVGTSSSQSSFMLVHHSRRALPILEGERLSGESLNRANEDRWARQSWVAPLWMCLSTLAGPEPRPPEPSPPVRITPHEDVLKPLPPRPPPPKRSPIWESMFYDLIAVDERTVLLLIQAEGRFSVWRYTSRPGPQTQPAELLPGYPPLYTQSPWQRTATFASPFKGPFIVVHGGGRWFLMNEFGRAWSLPAQVPKARSGAPIKSIAGGSEPDSMPLIQYRDQAFGVADPSIVVELVWDEEPIREVIAADDGSSVVWITDRQVVNALAPQRRAMRPDLAATATRPAFVDAPACWQAGRDLR